MQKIGYVIIISYGSVLPYGMHTRYFYKFIGYIQQKFMILSVITNKIIKIIYC